MSDVTQFGQPKDERTIKLLQKVLLVVGFCRLLTVAVHGQDIDSIAPVVVETVPEAGSKDVSPGTVKIRVTFSKPMADQSWSWATVWNDSTPEIVGTARYEADQETCVLKVKLEPNKTYGFWLNSQEFHNFQDQQGHPAIPYLFVFKTKSS